MDWGMTRSGQQHTTRELARRLRYGYAYAVEFLELGLGDAEEQRRFAGQENQVGYHGAAVLFRQRTLEVKGVRLERSGGWFNGQRGERRVGGRIALLCRFSIGEEVVTFAAVHLESDTDGADRCAQMGVLLDAIESLGVGQPALIGGDLNTFSLSHAELYDDSTLQKALREDPGRLLNPVPHEPLFDLARRYGFEWDSCNLLGVPTQRLSPFASPGRKRMKIDWFLGRGMEAFDPGVVLADDPLDSSGLSDHEAIAVSIKPRAYRLGNDA